MASSTKEIITLQFGHYSNFVGTHWWNLQEASFVYGDPEEAEKGEINHDVLFREGLNPRREVTYTPRLVVFDLKGSLNTLKQEGILYEVPEIESEVPWHGDVTMHKLSPSHRNEFLRDLDKHDKQDVSHADVVSHSEADCAESDEREVEEMAIDESGLVRKLYNLDDSVKVWSDFLRIHLHPKTVHIIDAHQHSNQGGFEIYSQGTSLQQDYQHQKEVEDRLHFFLEESDYIQGFQVLVDAYDGFGGLAAQTLQHLNDEYGNKGLLTTALSPTVFQNEKLSDDRNRLVNLVLAYSELTEYSSALVPMSLSSHLWKASAPTVPFPHLSYKGDLHYHTSAVLAATLETMTLPFRLTSNPSFVSHMTGAMTSIGRKVLGMQSSLPFPLLRGGHMVSSLMSLGSSLPWQSLTPMHTAQTGIFCQSIAVRGIDRDKINRPNDPTTPKLLREATSISDVVQLYAAETFPNAPSAFHSTELPVKTVTPFPRIFSPEVSHDGCICDKHDKPRSASQEVEHVPVMTSLQCSEGTGSLLHSLHKEASRLNLKRLHHFAEAGLEEDNYKEALHSIQTLAGNYEQHDMD